MRRSLSQLPALPCAAGMAIGIVSVNLGAGVWAIAIGAVVFAVMMFLGRRYLAYFALMLTAGAALAWVRVPQQVPNTLCGRVMCFSGQVLSATPGANSTQCVIRLDSCEGEAIEPLKCAASVKYFTPGLKPGARVEINAKLIDPASQNLLPYEADYQKYLKYDDIACRAWLLPAAKARGNLEQGECIAVTEPAAGWRKALYDTRSALAEAIVDSPVDGETAAFLLAVILGEDSFLDGGVKESFSGVGLSHALALSGLHVGVIAGLLAFLLFPTRFFRSGFYLRPVLTGLLVWGYALLVGMGPSVTRAAAMLSVFIAARLLQRGANPFNSLCVAAVVVMAIYPYSIFTPGFQLSFAAVLSILLFCRIEPRWLRRRPILRFAVGLVAVPVAAMLGTGLISAYYFHAMPWLFIPANMLAGICLPVLLSIGVLLMFLTLCGLSVCWLGVIANWLCWLLSVWAEWLASLGAQGQGLFFSPWAIPSFLMALVLAGLAIRKKRWALWTASATMLAASVVIITAWQERPPRAELYIPDGREGAIVVQSGGQARLVAMDDGIDSAAVVEEYGRRFELFLLSRGCDTLQFMSDGEQVGPFYYSNGVLVAADKSIGIATSRRPAIQVDYLIVGKGFVGRANDLGNADTVLFSSALSPARAKKLRRDLQENPSRDLRTHPFRIVID